MREPGGVTYTLLSEGDAGLVGSEFSGMTARHLCFSDGFTVAAMERERAVGILAVAWKELPPWVPPTREAFINVIEVVADRRRNGIGRHLVEFASEKVRAEGGYQIRAWSSDDRPAAHALWHTMGFAICPATVYPKGQEIEGCYVARVL